MYEPVCFLLILLFLLVIWVLDVRDCYRIVDMTKGEVDALTKTEILLNTRIIVKCHKLRRIAEEGPDSLVRRTASRALRYVYLEILLLLAGMVTVFSMMAKL